MTAGCKYSSWQEHLYKVKAMAERALRWGHKEATERKNPLQNLEEVALGCIACLGLSAVYAMNMKNMLDSNDEHKDNSPYDDLEREFVETLMTKYVKGQAVNGDNLWERSDSVLARDLVEEITDAVVYALTLVDQKGFLRRPHKSKAKKA